MRQNQILSDTTGQQLELANRLGGLRLASNNNQQLNQQLNPAESRPSNQLDDDLDDEIPEAEEEDGDGPRDTVSIQVYTTAQHFANMQTLDDQHSTNTNNRQ